MAKFSVSGEDDGEGPSNPRQKRLRTSVDGQNEEVLDDAYLEEVLELADGYEDEEDVVVGEVAELKREAGSNGDGLISPERSPVPLGSNRDSSISVTLNDPEVLDCSICFNSLNIPVFQCENGHIACSSCCQKLRNKCPSCSWPIGYNRCRAIEKVLESVNISCTNTKYGCKETMSYSKKHDHEKTCIYTPCSCPIPDCNFVGSSKQLSQHFSLKHSSDVKRFQYNRLFHVTMESDEKFLILQEESEASLFILCNIIELIGNLVRVYYFGRMSSMRKFPYVVIAEKEGSKLWLQSFTDCVSGYVDTVPTTGFLTVPCDFINPRGVLALDVCIRDGDGFPAAFSTVD